jgi:hypothetical protein
MAVEQPEIAALCIAHPRRTAWRPKARVLEEESNRPAGVKCVRILLHTAEKSARDRAKDEIERRLGKRYAFRSGPSDISRVDHAFRRARASILCDLSMRIMHGHLPSAGYPGAPDEPSL